MMESIKVMNVPEFATAGWGLRRITAAEHARSDLPAQSYLKPRFEMLTRLRFCFSDLSLWFSLPLSVWLSSGWIGVIFHWQAITAMACPVKGLSDQQKATLTRNVAL